jgi:hypothetical protein
MCAAPSPARWATGRGKFELADGGTLFLDEVAELPLQVQAKLLRVLQGGHLQRLGSDREHRVDVRVIAASNRNLADEVRAGPAARRLLPPAQRVPAAGAAAARARARLCCPSAASSWRRRASRAWGWAR